MGALPGRPLIIKSLSNLTDFVTSVMFTASAGHSVVNFGQFDYYSFIPNRPLFLTRLLPPDTSLINMQYIMSALPDVNTAEETIVLARTLTYMEPAGLLDAYRFGENVPTPEQIKAGNVKPAAFAPVYQLNPSAYKQYVTDLERIESEIRAANEKEKLYYPYLLPKVRV
jgi:arachidonate 5-lipoxygenase